MPTVLILVGISIQVLHSSKRIKEIQIESIWPVIFLSSISNIIVLALISGDLISSNNGLIFLGILSGYCSKSKFLASDSNEY